MKKMYSLLLSMTIAILLSSSSWATDYYVATTGDDANSGLIGFPKLTIQAAVNTASAGDVVIVAAGTYVENVSINKALTLRSASGRASTIITGSTGTLGTLLIQANNVTIGGFGQGFTINGYDNINPGLEYAAIYIQGVRSNITIRDNDIVANGEAGLLTEFGQAVTNLVVNANTFSGKTFVGATAGGCGFSGSGGQTDQFTEPNTPRQLVNIATGTGITFTSNNITGIAGSTSSVPACATFGQGNTLVTIDANNATIRGNTFAGTTTRFGSSLRARGTGANIACNTFSNTGLGAACTHIVLNAGSLAGLGSPNSLAGIASQNTFNEGAYFTGALQIYRDAAQVAAQPGPPVAIAVNTTVLANVTNTNTGEKFCSIQSAIDDANTANGHTITVASGTYSEQVLVNKSLTVKGVGITKPIINFTGTVSGKPTLFDVSQPNVTIENFDMRVDLTKLSSAIIASAVDIDGITVKDNTILATGSSAAASFGSYGNRNAVSINYGGNINYRIAVGGVDNITFTGNTVSGETDAFSVTRYFRSAVSVDEGGGAFSGNTLQTINHDILVRFASNGAVNITGNNLNGGGVELSDQNAAAGTFTVSGNTFNATFANVSAPGAAVLRVKNNYNSIPHSISSNTFTNFDWAISLENMNAVTLNSNTFTGMNPTSRAVVFNTKSISSNSNAIVQVPVALTMTNNAFGGTGTALSFLNHDSDNDSYGTFTLGTVGNENTFAATLSNFIFLDGQTGGSGSSTFPVYFTPHTGGWPTTMACWDQNLDIKNNKFDIGAGLQLPQSMNLAQRTLLEGKLDHKPDLACKGSLQFFLPVHNLTQNTYYSTIQAGVTAANANDVIECSEGTYNEAVTIDKSLTLQGINTDKSLQVINGTGLGIPDGISGITIANGITNVTIKNFTIQNFTGKNGNSHAGIYGIGGNNNLIVTNVALLNNPTASGFYANGPVSNVSITNSTVSNNGAGARGIVIWNGFKQGITITNNNLSNNNCCGIELQEGTASNVNVSGNTIDIGVGDNAIGITGLNNSVGPNLINNNIITGGGRFGIEIKNPAGGVTVSGNNVTLTTQNVDLRDRAGIAVFRRVVQPGNVDVPNGVTITGNTVTGYQQSSTSEGFGIVIEGTNHAVTGNTLNNNEVGILQQQNPSGYPGDADQSNLADQYFGRGNSPITCGNTISGNTFSGNTTDTRNIGVGAGLVTNTNTNEYFCSIQPAIDDAQTLAGHTITVAAGTYNENVNINKSLTLRGPNHTISPNGGVRVAEAIITGGLNVDNAASKTVVVEGFQFQGVTSPLNYNGNGVSTVVLDITFRKNLINSTSGQLAIFTGSATNTANATIQDNRFLSMSSNAMQLNSGSGGVTTAQITDNTIIGTVNAGMNVALTNSLINGNTISNTAQQGIQVADASGNITVSNNIITNANTSADANRGGIRIRGTSFTGPVNITNNIISGSTNGISVPPGENITGKVISVTNNNLSGNTFGIKNSGTGLLNATCNWYGVTGASVPPLISGSVTFEPFLTNGTDNDAAIGFQPVPGSCNGCSGGGLVTNTNTGELFCTIQAAINDADTQNGHTITVAAGTYNENVNVTKSLTITGAGKGSNPVSNTVLSPSSACGGVGITIAAANVTVSNMYLTGYETGVLLNGVASPKLNDLTIVDYCFFGVNLGGSNQNIEIKQSTIQRTTPLAGTVGVRAGTANAVNGLLIDGCTINGNTQGMFVAQATTPVAFDNITIQNSTISNNTQKGLYFEKLSNALLSNLTMDNNGTDATYGFNNGIDINLKYSSYSNITIQNSDITNSGATGIATDPQTPAAITIKARDDASSYNTIPASLSGVILQNNKITGPTNGIRFGEFGKINATPTNITVQNNDLSHPFTGKAVISRINGNIDMKCNWHGTTDVATIQSTFTTAGSGLINLITYLTSGTDNAPAVGFQPTPGSCTGCPNFVPTISVTETSGTTNNDGTICNGASVTLTASVGSSYLWSTNATTQGITVSPGTTTPYTVTVTDANNCVADASTTVTVITVTAGSLSSNVASICQGGSVDISHTGNTGTGSFVVFQNGTVVASFATLEQAEAFFPTAAPGQYCVYSIVYSGLNAGCGNFAGFTLAQVIDACLDDNCYDVSQPLCITVNALPTPTITVTETSGTTNNDGTICNGASVTLTASAGTSYLWNTTATTQAITVAPGTTTLYTVTVTDANSCVADASTTVTVNPLPTPSITIAETSGTTNNDGTICNGASVTLTASAGASYLWNTNATTQAITVAPSSTTPYSVTVTDGNGCSATANTTVTVNTLSTAPTGITGTTTICAGGSTTLTISGGSAGTGASAEWFTGSCGGTPAGTGNSITVSPSNTTAYFVRYNGTCNTTTCANTTVTVNTLSTVPTAITGTTTICAGGSTTLTVSGGNAGTAAVAEWFTGTCGGTPAGTGNSITVSPTTNTTYFVRYNGTCNTTSCASTTVTVNTLSTAPTGITGTTTICSGGSTTLTISGGSAGTGASAEWFTGTCGGTPAGTGNSITVSPTTNTTYFVRYNGTCNTTSCASTTVTVNTLSTAPTAITGTTTICSGGSTTLTISGGSAGTGASAEWFTGTCGGTPAGTGNSITVSPTNTTTYFVRFNGTCNTTTCATITVTVNPLPTASISGITAVCQNAPFPQITFTGSGGTAPYTFTYKINGGADQTVTTTSGNSVTVNQTTANAGDFEYTLVSVKDASSTQCSQSQNGSATITVHALPVVSTPQNALCTGLNMTLSPTSGGTWQSSNPSMASVNNAGLVTGIAPGVVSFTFTQTSTGCSAATANVTIKPTPTSNLSASKYDVCPNTEVTLTPNCSIPTSSVNWNPGGPTVTPDAATIPYVYRARCVADGCVGNETEVTVRTHRILVDMKDLDVGPLPKAIVRAVKDNMEPTNLIQAPAFPRRWTFIATGCDASEAAVFKLSGPVNFNTIDNAATYAMFANDAGGFYSIDHPNYGNGGSFPNGTYTLTIDLRSQDGVGGPFPKNRVAVGSLLATRTLQFTVGSPSVGRAGLPEGLESNNEVYQSDKENWMNILQNPVNDELTVQLTGKVNEEIQLSLTNLQGQTNQQRNLKLVSSQQYEILNVRNIPSGMYILKAIKGENVKTIKVIKVE